MAVVICVLLVCAAGLTAFRWHLDARPAITPDELATLKEAHNKLVRTVGTVANKIGLNARID